ncbi:formimidoylglutamase [Flavilitoribacter nigricans]|nr:formimidoylglutamase [Flavilitoribacter nigricans]
MPKWKIYDKEDVKRLTKVRPGETKIGEIVSAGAEGLDHSRLAIIGIPEDIGIRANLGTGGATTAWNAFLPAYLNLQSTQSLRGAETCIYGYLDCSDLQHLKHSESVSALREAVNLIDQAVAGQVDEIVAAGCFPVVIGGGHNNAYPILRGAASGYHRTGRIAAEKLDAINLDAHSDFRRREGRHSGNGFRYAFDEGILEKYAMIGLHRNYNAANVIDEMAREANIHYCFWEEIFLEERCSFKEAVLEAIAFTRSGTTGIELDLDAIAGVLSSAMSPSGITSTQARQYLHLCGSKAPVAYLHICEGAVRLDNGLIDPTTGKLIAYLVSDFVRALGQNRSFS